MIWYEYSTYCNDTLNLCTDNFDGDYNVYLGTKFYMTIEPTADGYIPDNYFCNWTLGLDAQSKYSLTVERTNISLNSTKETEYVFLNLQSSLYGDSLIYDKQLRSRNGNNNVSFILKSNEYI